SSIELGSVTDHGRSAAKRSTHRVRYLSVPSSPVAEASRPEHPVDLKETVNLPKTGFPMRAALAEREPIQVRAWLTGKVYEKLVAQNEGRERFVLHDGPPYANGSLHLGHFLNKVLKDVIVKRASMSGKLADYVPGWDCHGLPIERQVDKQLGPKKREMSASDFRRACRRFAEEQ